MNLGNVTTNVAFEQSWNSLTFQSIPEACVTQEKQQVIAEPLRSADLLTYTDYELFLVIHGALKRDPFRSGKFPAFQNSLSREISCNKNL